MYYPDKPELKFYMVNGDYIRTNIDSLFDQIGTNIDYSFIPEDEVWIDIRSDVRLLGDVMRGFTTNDDYYGYIRITPNLFGLEEQLADALSDLVYTPETETTYYDEFRMRIRRALLIIAMLYFDETTAMLAVEYEVNEQTKYLNDFISDMRRGELSDAQISNRARMYASSLPKFYNQLWLQQQGDKKLAWKYNPEAKHCGGCIELDGMVRPAYEWYSLGIYPRSGTTQCLSNCKCELVPVD